MEDCYITVADAGFPDLEIIRVYPTELRRQFLPLARKNFRVQNNNQNEPFLDISIEYARTDCIVSLNTVDGPTVLIDCVEDICANCDEFLVTFSPSHIKIKFLKNEMIKELKKMLYFSFPDILTSNRFGQYDLIEDFENDGRGMD